MGTERPSSCRYVVPPLIYLKDRIRNAIVETCTETLGLCNDVAEMIADFTGVPGVVDHERFCGDNEFQVYEVGTSTWTGKHHHGDNVYFDTYECGVVEIRITSEVTEPESITELNVGDMVLAKEPHSRKRTYKGVVKERTAGARYKIQALPHSRKIVSTVSPQRETQPSALSRTNCTTNAEDTNAPRRTRVPYYKGAHEEASYRCRGEYL